MTAHPSNVEAALFLNTIALRPVTPYGLSKNHLTPLLETLHEGWDFAPRLRSTLGHFRRWAR